MGEVRGEVGRERFGQWFGVFLQACHCLLQGDNTLWVLCSDQIDPCGNPRSENALKVAV